MFRVNTVNTAWAKINCNYYSLEYCCLCVCVCVCACACVCVRVCNLFNAIPSLSSFHTRAGLSQYWDFSIILQHQYPDSFIK